MGKSVDHCLFCRDIITPYSLSSQDDENVQNNYSPPNFNNLCNLLGIKFTDDYLKQLSNVPAFCKSSSGRKNGESCEKFLCLCCFEMVDKLTKLLNEVKEIQLKIISITSRIRSVIIKPSSPTDVSPSRRRGRSKRNCNSLEFLEAFQSLVKESEVSNDSTNDDKERKEKPPESVSPTATKQLKKKGKSLKSNKVILNIVHTTTTHEDVELQNTDPSGVKVEVDVDDTDTWDEPNDFVHLDEETDTAIVNAINDLKELHPSFQSSNSADEEAIVKNQQAIDDVPVDEKNVALVAEISEEQNKPKPSKVRKRRKRKNPTSEDDSESADPPTEKKHKKSSQKLDFHCRYCNITFPNHSKYYAHRKTHATVIPLNPDDLNITTYYETENNKRILIRACSICDYKAKGRRLYLFMEHMLCHENTADLLSPLHPCDMCDKKFMLKLNLDLHKICQHDWKHLTLKCDVCGDLRSKSQDELVAHLKSHGSETSIYRCKSCYMACTSLDSLLAHMKKHSSSKRLFCPQCPFLCNSLKEMYQHCNQAHSDLKETFKCDHCEKSFLMSLSLQKHLASAHGIGNDAGFGSFVCSQCNNGRVYKTKAGLERHIMYLHGSEESKPFKCDKCDKSFPFKSHLQLHVEDKHDKIRFPCPHCPKSYTERTQLNYHMRTHTGEGLYTCDTCGKQFPRLGQLKVHSVVHLEINEQTKCVCEECGKEFGNSVRLRHHKASQHKEKTLKCQYCNMMFRRKDNLRGHLRTHTGERPYVCFVCTKGFNRRDILFVHMKMHGYSQDEAAKAYDKHVEHLKQENLLS